MVSLQIHVGFSHLLHIAFGVGGFGQGILANNHVFQPLNLRLHFCALFLLSLRSGHMLLTLDDACRLVDDHFVVAG